MFTKVLFGPIWPIRYFFVRFSLIRSIQSTLVLLCPLQSYSVHFGPIRSKLVLSVHFVYFDPLQSYSGYSVHFSPIRSNLFWIFAWWLKIHNWFFNRKWEGIFSILFSTFCPLQSYLVHIGPVYPLQSYSVYFALIRSIMSTSILFGPFSPIHSYLVSFSPIPNRIP